MSNSRRDFLWDVGGGLGGLAVSQMLAQRSDVRLRSDQPKSGIQRRAASPSQSSKRVIQLFMTGGASPMDTYDYKPELEKLHGQKLGPEKKPEGFTAMPGAIMKSPFKFKQHGESGRWVSSVFPHQAEEVDQMAFLMAMASKTNVHGPGTYMMNSGFLLPGFPSMGAWISYGLGNLTDELPTFVVLPDAKGLPYNQKGPFSSGFLPAVNQGTVINASGNNPDARLVRSGKIQVRNTPRRPRRLRITAEAERRARSEAVHRIRNLMLGSSRTNWLPACSCPLPKRLMFRGKANRLTKLTG